MARQQLSTHTKTTNAQNTSHGLAQADITSFFGTMAGVVVGVLIALGMTGPMVRSQVADATKNLNATVASHETAGNSCADTSVAQTAAVGSGAVGERKIAQAGGGSGAGTMPEGGRGADSGEGKWVEKWVGNQWSNTSASMNNTGPNSQNAITTTNNNTTKVTNNNSVKVENKSEQKAESGSANVSGNTNGGSANSGAAENENRNSTSINVTN